MPYRCRSCRKFFRRTTGTAIQSSKVGLRIRVIAVYLLTTEVKGRASVKAHRDLGVTQKAAWQLAHRLPHASEDNCHASPDAALYADATAYRGSGRPHETLEQSVNVYFRQLGNEFAGGHCIRELDAIGQMRSVVRGLEGTRHRFAHLIA